MKKEKDLKLFYADSTFIFFKLFNAFLILKNNLKFL